MSPLRLEALEERALLSITSLLSGSVLSLTGDPNTSHNVLVRSTPNAPPAANPAQSGSVDVIADGVTTTYQNLTQVNYQGGVQNDVFTDRVSNLGGVVRLGNGNNVVYSTVGSTIVLAGNGNNVIQNTGTFSTTTVGNGNNNVYGGVSNSINVGSGVNVIYDILPSPNIPTTVNVAAHTGIDHLYTGPQTILTGAEPTDHVAQFFVAAPLGSGKLVQSGQTVYFAATNAGNQLYSFGSSALLVVANNLNDGTGFHTQTFTGVTQIAAFGGSGADTFINSSSVDDAQYGAGGSNFLVGGFGSLDLEKAGGAAATGSTAIGRSAVANDLNLSGLTNTSNTAIFAGGPTAHNIVRTNSPTDTIVGLNTVNSPYRPADILVSLYPDFVSASLLPPFVPA